MLVPALEVLCHLLLPWLSGTDLCGRAEPRSLGDQEIERRWGKAGPLGFLWALKAVAGSWWELNPAPESRGIHTDRPRSQASP